MKSLFFGPRAGSTKTRRYSGNSCKADDCESFVCTANFSPRVKKRFIDDIAASPAFFQIAAGALVASGVWAVAVLVWGL